MILRTVRIRDFKSVTDSGEVPIDEAVTCLVGKNESGKTAFLEALYRLNPVATGHSTDFVPLRDFPRPRYTTEDDIPNIRPISATFDLEDDDVAAVEKELGAGVLGDRTITVSKTYGNVTLWRVDHDDSNALKHLINKHGVDPTVVNSPKTLAELNAAISALGEEAPDSVKELGAAAEAFNIGKSIRDVLKPRLPRFYYFDEYSELPGRVSIPLLQERAEGDLNPGQRTALALLRLAGVASEEFKKEDYEARKASLEAASSAISKELFEYWSQNKNLRVYFDADFVSPAEDPETPPYLEIRIENVKYWVTLNFSERSAGFQWFFSFLAAFSEFRSEKNLVLLLDEPALGLHAAAQSDLLRYIDEKLAPNHVVAYSTHSPFLVDPKRIDRVRTVEDREDEGTVVSADVLGTSQDTVFPLQAALGYELAQSLFVGPNVVLVEGPADFIYLTVLSDVLSSAGREGLDDRWVISPVGGIDKVPTFIALLKTQVNIAVVLDEAAGGSSKINDMVDRKVIAAKNIISLASITGTKEADIEDLFKDTFYLKLARESGAASVKKEDLKAGDRIVKRMEEALGKRFNHYTPARHLLTDQGDLVPLIDDDTLDRFEKLFKTLNPLLDT